jgi:predicted RNA binding protein YcfA (HicA-like mRNA interferase family)
MKTVSGKRFAKILRRKGWALIGINGSHHKYASPDGQSIVIVPIHKNDDLKTGLQRALMKDAGVEEEEL